MEQADEQLEKAFDESSPRLNGSICLGRTVHDMYHNHKQDNILTFANGIEVKLGAGFSSLVFKAASEGVPHDYAGVAMLSGIAAMKGRNEIFYRTPEELKDTF